MFGNRTTSESVFHYVFAALIAVTIAIIASHYPAAAQDAGQRKFKSPEDAFKALVDAAKDNDTKALLAIFGPDSKDIISSGDSIADSAALNRFVKAAGEEVRFAKLDNGAMLPIIGKGECSFPIPIVKSGNEWVFATEEGKEEILNRRIGKNELNTIEVVRAIADAQRDYASKDRDGDGVLQYAEHFLSREGKRDGLYWEAEPGGEQSPLGPLVAHAAEEGYPVGKHTGKYTPYHGYYFKMLKGQGSNAPGGDFDYIINGKMVAGFGVVAYPAEYGVSGIMTFMVNQLGMVYEKDLGTRTEEIAKAMTKYDPDKTWKKVK
ncbi:MAG TPA: DUF2950 domain-containing protein [Thermodesulfovibrionales bacterium]|nr:DUF2950 domain-containing protein [Thermodesulfovibrionales bacterium]